MERKPPRLDLDCLPFGRANSIDKLTLSPGRAGLHSGRVVSNDGDLHYLLYQRATHEYRLLPMTPRHLLRIKPKFDQLHRLDERSHYLSDLTSEPKWIRFRLLCFAISFVCSGRHFSLPQLFGTERAEDKPASDEPQLLSSQLVRDASDSELPV